MSSSHDERKTALTALLQVQLVDAFGSELPYIDATVGSTTHRCFIGQAGQRFGVRADWYGLTAADRHKSRWVVLCEIDGNDVCDDRDAGRSPGGKETNTACVFKRSEREGVEFELVFGETTVENVEDDAVVEDVADSAFGHVRVVVRKREDLPGYYSLRQPMRAPAALPTINQPAIFLPSTTKFWHAPGLSLAYTAPADTILAPLTPPAKKAKVEGTLQRPTKKRKSRARFRNYKYGPVVVQKSVYFDTAERLALRQFLPETHPQYPRQYMEAQQAMQELNNSKRHATADFNSSGVEYTCDLTSKEEAEVWQASKKRRVEHDQEREEVDATV